ncbi:hypothetical protein BB560_000184 [Smittium megazygosporum]|uniref:Glucosamine 6-phosphate N-acetyltransferase n=1 Tax=Smittium megazygosporum TaxID=133381 RepID=A0A2T9ZL36_9FUNG|nr:hypothetical protein BB560_000184 [Smittium megazygosporum]
MSNEFLFDPTILGPNPSFQISKLLGPNFSLRPLKITDHADYLKLLQTLTSVGEVSSLMFAERFRKMVNGSKYILVIQDSAANKLIATGSLLTEYKFARNCGILGHIEDVAVLPEYQGKKLGFLIIDALKSLASTLNCYKLSLNCTDHNISFYQKCSFEKKENQMVLYMQQNQKL